MAVIDQKEYLKKYLGLGDSKDAKKKKKKKKHAAIVGRCKIVDDELGIPIVSVGDDDGVAADFDDVLAAPDELPQIAAIIDERPPELREAEFSNSDRWARVGASNFASGDGEAVNGERFHPSDRNTRDFNASLLRSRKGRESDASPGGRQRPDSDESPGARGKNDSDASPPRARQRHDSDASPPRARQRHDSDASPPRARRRHDSDASPPRERQAPVRNSSLSGRSHTSPARRRRRHDSDASPPRKLRRQSPDGNDSDLSPPRIPEPIVMDFPLVQVKEEPLSPSSSPRASRRSSARDEKGRRTKTMDGKRAGLQRRDILREENEAAREREKAAIIAAGEAVTGKDAKTVVRRNRKEEERQRKKEEKAARKAIVAAKYQEWSAGVATTQQRQQQAADIAHEMSKPLARYADDEDLERSLKERERADDPMLEYMRKKKLEKLKETNPGYVERPKYKPPPQPPINRYNIWPGYRWDGVDRSNGFENDFFSKQASRKAQQEEAYKWSVEDM